MLLSVSLFLRYRQFWLKHFLLSFGLAFLLTFIVIRAISFHHFDEVLKHSISGVKMNWFLELSGIGLVWLAAAIDCYKSKSPSTASHQSP
jgi:hypothetical protein